MTDNGRAALTTALQRASFYPYRSGVDYGAGRPIEWEFLREQERAALLADAAAILAERGVFLPDGLGPVMVGMAKEIAALRDALEEITKTRPASWNWADSDEMDRAIRIARSALVAAKETQG